MPQPAIPPVPPAPIQLLESPGVRSALVPQPELALPRRLAPHGGHDRDHAPRDAPGATANCSKIWIAHSLPCAENNAGWPPKWKGNSVA